MAHSSLGGSTGITKIEMDFKLCIFVCLFLALHGRWQRRSSKLHPVFPLFDLNMTHLNYVNIDSNGTTMKELRTSAQRARTRPLLFEEYLSSISDDFGNRFQFDLSKWQTLKSCGLFRNLQAKLLPMNDGNYTIRIDGEELPSIHFAPEVQVGASLDTPTMSGGFIFRDNNFRGLGERIEAVINTNSESSMLNTNIFMPNYHFKWTDGIRNRKAYTTLSIDNDYSTEIIYDVSPPFLESSSKKSGRLSNQELSKQLKTRISKIALRFFGTKRFTDLKSNNIAHDNYNNNLYGDSYLSYSIEPYHIHLTDQDIARETKKTSSKLKATSCTGIRKSLSGAKFDFVYGPGNRFLSHCKVCVEKGISSFVIEDDAQSSLIKQRKRQQLSNHISNNKGQNAGYEVFGLQIFTAPILLLQMTSPLHIKSKHIEQKNGVVLNTNDNKFRDVQLFLKLKWDNLYNRGNGCIPLYHFANFRYPKYFRGQAQSEEDDIQLRKPIYSAIKADIVMENAVVRAVKPGIFCDLVACMSLDSLNQLKSEINPKRDIAHYWGKSDFLTSWGCFFKASGFRVDLAWKMNDFVKDSDKNLRPVFYLGLDQD